ncbi:MAG: YhcN/YlaJ family sporulation lipoprotein [Clostridia bacterium]|nr:YhcN/YlaJ family sporulation lipoprotein [Clostridia bacterium]
MKRTILILSVCLALAVTLTGCASNADGNVSVSPGMTTPGASPMVSPNVTDGAMGEMGKELSDALTGKTVSTAEEALTASKALRDSVQKLTEVDTAVAVVTGTTALVGVTFDPSYQGGMDERFLSMVLDRAQGVHGGVTSVAVTADADAVSEITSLYQLLQGGSPYSTVKTEAEALAKKLDVYRKE